ncbi:hypothetical protein HDU98_001219 [Podochytrium sp. JEL0797]|nr:hypothetical protein HDU98_001219 [Podochytrium sp. JEL0797]
MTRPTTTHRHKNAISNAQEYIRSIFDDPTCWKQVNAIDGVKISVKQEPQNTQQPQSNSQLPTFRGDGVIQNSTVQEVLSVLRGFGARATWDPRFEKGKLLETLSDTENLYLSSQSGNLLVRSRDFVTANGCVLENSADEALLVSVSVEDALAPPEGFFGSYVRADAKAIAWILKQEGNNVGITYIVEVDVKGQIPRSLIQLIQVQAPLCIRNVSESIQKNGTLPFVVFGLSPFSKSHRLAIRNEWIDPDTAHYTITATVPPKNSNLTIAMPVKGKYALGGGIEILKISGITMQARQISSRAEMAGVVGDMTGTMIQIQFVSTLLAGQDVQIFVKPYTHKLSKRISRLSVSLRGAASGGVECNEPIYEMNGERVVEAIQSPVDSAIGGMDELEVKSERKPRVTHQLAPMLKKAQESLDQKWAVAVEATTNLVVQGYGFATSLWYGKPKVGAVQQTRYKKIDDDRMLNEILEYVLDPEDAWLPNTNWL